MSQQRAAAHAGLSSFLLDRTGQGGGGQETGRVEEDRTDGATPITTQHSFRYQPQPVGSGRTGQQGSRQLTTRGRGRPGAAPGHAPHWEGSPGVRGVDRGGVSSYSPSRTLEAGPVQAAWWEGVSWAAGHGSRAAVAQTLLTGAGRAWWDGRGSGRGQRVGEVTLPSDLPSEARRFVDLRQRCEIHDVVVSVWTQVCRALAGLVAVLQKDGGSSLIRSPSSFIIGPFPVHTTAQARGLGEQGAANGPGLSWKSKRRLSMNKLN